MLVVDASIVIDALAAADDRGTGIRSLLEKADLLAPYVIDLEVTQGLRRIALSSGGDTTSTLHRFRLLTINRFEHLPLLPRVWELRDNLTAHDAAYVALAEATGAPLVTADRKIAATPSHRAEVILV
jgi:predicted nucleic acid-binding protein